MMNSLLSASGEDVLEQKLAADSARVRNFTKNSLLWQRRKMQINQNDKLGVTSAELAKEVKIPRGISTNFIVADDMQKSKQRSEALAKVYRLILSPEWGQS